MTTAKTTKVKKGKIGSSFSSYLKDQGTLAETASQAIKRVIAFEVAKSMKEKSITRTAMASKLSTSRSQIDRLLDPEKDGVSIRSLASAAEVVGRELTISLK